jgi:hypothetical protein
VFWSGLGGFALLFVLFLVRNRVPVGDAGPDGADTGGAGSSAEFGDAPDRRNPDGGFDDD